MRQVRLVPALERTHGDTFRVAVADVIRVDVDHHMRHTARNAGRPFFVFAMTFPRRLNGYEV